MRCLVTGASGFLGSHLTRTLVRQGHEVLAVVRPGKEHLRLKDVSDQVAFAYADLEGIKTITSEIDAFHPEVVFHLAWWGGNSRKYINDPDAIYANIPGTLDLIRIVKNAGCKAFLYFGTAVEYGIYNIPVRESDPVHPQNLYGAAKYAGMVLLQALCTQWELRFCGIRPFWVYGPMDDTLRMIPSVILQLLAGEKPKTTAGEQVWDFLYIDDAVDALIQLATTDAEGIFNLASGEPVQIKQVISILRDCIDPALEIGFGEVPYAPDQVMHLEADISRLRAATGWDPKVSLPDGLRRTVDWFRMENKHGK